MNFPRALILALFSLLLLGSPLQAQYRHLSLFSGPYTHEPVKADDCTACHDVHFPKAGAQLKTPMPALCYVCHSPFKGKSVHSPVSQGRCTGCHDAHTSSRRGLLSSKIPEMCLGCHPDRKGGRHGKRALTGSCITCHDPHASDRDKLLTPLPAGSCIGCHQEVLAGKQRHTALDVEDCAGCHNPHASPPKSTVKCSDCHDVLRDGDIAHEPVSEGCGDCHRTHAGQESDLLVSAIPGLCLDCHDDKAEGQHGMVVTGMDCNRCHDPHSSTSGSMLREGATSAPCAVCHLQLDQGLSVHTPVREGRCNRCHDPHTSPPVPTTECRDCHSRILDGRYRHEVAVEDCGNCHSAHASNNRDQLNEPVEQLCVACHDDKANGLHGRVAVGTDCTRCHDPHAAMQPKLLTMTTDAAPCTSCHKRVLLGPVVHTPVPEEDCDACHDPHNAQPGEAMSCSDCHDDLLTKGTLHAPLEDGCLDCHESHSSTLANLLRSGVPELCLQCHDDKQGGRHGSSIMSEACIGCHDPHSSPRKGLMRDLGEQDCDSCHDSKVAGEYVHTALQAEGCPSCHNPHVEPPLMPPAPCESCHRGLADRSPLHGGPSRERCGECHDPHSSDNPGLMKALKMDSRDECLDCHSETRRRIERGRIVHEPAASGACTDDCHTVHIGKSPYTQENFQRSPYTAFKVEEFSLCFSCHETSLVMSPYTEKDTLFRNMNRNLHYLHVYRDGKKGYSCWACHDSHASGQPHLLKPETSWTPVYRLKVLYTQRERGGSCETNCHTTKEYSR